MISFYSGKIMLLNILPGSLGASIPQVQTKITAAGIAACCDRAGGRGPR